MANVPISAFTVPANTVGIGATGYSLTGSASASFMDLAGTWNTSGTPTAIKLNITDTASNAASLLMDLQVGGASRANVAKGGSLALAGDMTVGSATGGNSFVVLDTTGVRVSALRGLGFASGNSAGNTLDLLLTRRGAANLRLGAADAAAPVAQTLSVQSVVAGTTNTAGTNLTITGSQGTGTGAGGSLIFQVAPAGSSGSAQNALATALTINSASQVVFSSGSASAPSITFDTANTGIYGGSNAINFTRGGSRVASLVPNSFVFFSAGANISMADAGGSADVRLFRDAANTLALRNGTAAQTFRVYNTFTDASNYERATIEWSANNLIIGQDLAGSGARRDIYFQSWKDIYFRSGAGATTRWQISDSGGHFLAFADNTYDIGASGASRPRNVFVAGTVTSSGVAIGTNVSIPAASALFWSGRSEIVSPANKVVRIRDTAGTGPSILQSGQFVVADLPAAATYTGSMAFVSDATVTVARTTVAGGGSNKVMVMSDGTNWLIVA